MAGDLNIRAEIEYVLKDQGITAAVSKVKELETAQKQVTAETKKATEASSAFGGALRSIAGYAASFLAAGSIISFLRSAQREFIDAERSSVRLQMALRSLGAEYGSSFDDVSAYADEMERLTGVDADVVRSSQAVLVTIGRLSGETLLRATRAALNLSAALGTDLSNAAMIIAKAGAGAEGALSRMGIKIDASIPPGERLSALLKELEERTDGFAEAVGTTLPGAVDRATTAWGNFKEAIGKVFTNADGLSLWTATLKSFTDEINRLSDLMERRISVWKQFLGISEQIPRFPGAGSTPSYGSGIPGTPGSPPYETTVHGKSDEEIAKEQKAEEEARAQREKEEEATALRIAERRLEIFKDELNDEMAERGKAVDDQIKQLDFEKSLNESVSDRLDAESGIYEQLLQIAIDSGRAELEAKKASLEELRDYEKSVIDASVKDARIAAAKKLAVDQNYELAKQQLTKQSAMIEQQANWEAATASVEALGAIFGQKKGFAIALAIMNVARSVTAIMADETIPTVAKPAFIAAAIATGAVQIATIRAANMGGGGSAGGGGWKSGQNYARSVGSGQTGPAPAPYSTTGSSASSVTSIDQRRTGTTVIVNGPVVGGRAGVAELKRLLDAEDRSQLTRLVR